MITVPVFMSVTVAVCAVRSGREAIHSIKTKLRNRKQKRKAKKEARKKAAAAAASAAAAAAESVSDDAATVIVEPRPKKSKRKILAKIFLFKFKRTKKIKTPAPKQDELLGLLNNHLDVYARTSMFLSRNNSFSHLGGYPLTLRLPKAKLSAVFEDQQSIHSFQASVVDQESIFSFQSSIVELHRPSSVQASFGDERSSSAVDQEPSFGSDESTACESVNSANALWEEYSKYLNKSTEVQPCGVTSQVLEYKKSHILEALEKNHMAALFGGFDNTDTDSLYNHDVRPRVSDWREEVAIEENRITLYKEGQDEWYWTQMDDQSSVYSEPSFKSVQEIKLNADQMSIRSLFEFEYYHDFAGYADEAASIVYEHSVAGESFLTAFDGSSDLTLHESASALTLPASRSLLTLNSNRSQSEISMYLQDFVSVYKIDEYLGSNSSSSDSDSDDCGNIAYPLFGGYVRGITATEKRQGSLASVHQHKRQKRSLSHRSKYHAPRQWSCYQGLLTRSNSNSVLNNCRRMSIVSSLSDDEDVKAYRLFYTEFSYMYQAEAL